MMGPGINMVGAGRGAMVGAGGGVMGRVGGYGGPMMQVQSGYPPDMSSSVQSVQAVPNPSYLPTSSTGGVRQPAPPYDARGMEVSVCVCVCVCVPACLPACVRACVRVQFSVYCTYMYMYKVPSQSYIHVVLVMHGY